MIPLVNLTAQYARIRDEVQVAIGEVLESNAFIQGRFASRFEAEFDAALGAGRGVACANGTAAIALALEALGVGRGDEVITVPNTFIATAEAVLQIGAQPVFVDVDPRTHTLDPAALDAAVTPRTRAILPVHLFGNVADMDAILALARRHGLLVVEDAAQAHLAQWRGRSAGTLGDAGTFSFYPGKNLGAYGDAGYVTAADANVAERVRRLADHGRSTKYEHSLVGYNQRMDGLQAAVLSVKLRHLADWTAARRRNAALYRDALQVPGLQFAEPTPGADPVYHLMVVEVSNRDEVMRALEGARIACGIHYPLPLHLQPALAHLGGRRGMFPVAERLAGRVLSLPMCAELDEVQISAVATVFNRVARA
ncbi:MAG: DegT/DnrJ/EryC1/StrS family aminotransferase [Burkholderiales bacterium]